MKRRDQERFGVYQLAEMKSEKDEEECGEEVAEAGRDKEIGRFANGRDGKPKAAEKLVVPDLDQFILVATPTSPVPLQQSWLGSSLFLAWYRCCVGPWGLALSLVRRSSATTNRLVYLEKVIVCIILLGLFGLFGRFSLGGSSERQDPGKRSTPTQPHHTHAREAGLEALGYQARVLHA